MECSTQTSFHSGANIATSGLYRKVTLFVISMFIPRLVCSPATSVKNHFSKAEAFLRTCALLTLIPGRSRAVLAEQALSAGGG